VMLEFWPHHTDVSKKDAKQFKGCSVTITLN